MTTLLKFVKKTVLSVPILFFTSNILLTGCDRPKEERSGIIRENDKSQPLHSLVQLVGEDANWMDKFLRDYFLESSTIFVVLGDKPMSFTEIISASYEDLSKAVQPHLEGKSEKEKQRVLGVIRDDYRAYDLNHTWEKWLEWHRGCKSSPFLFRTEKTESPNLALGFIINTREMAWTLYKHYEVYKRELGCDFDPIAETLQFENRDSDFWESVLSNHLLQGIAFGFGERNAFFFSKDMASGEKMGSSPIFKGATIPLPDEQELKGTFKAKIRLPGFRSYCMHEKDSALEHFKEELSTIREQVTEDNFSQVILSKFIPVEEKQDSWVKE